MAGRPTIIYFRVVGSFLTSQITKRPRKMTPVDYYTHGQMSDGDLAVNCFLFIIGFLITASWQRSGSIKFFLLNRELRIFPGFIVASLSCYFVAGALGADNSIVYFQHHNISQSLIKSITLDMLDTLPIFEHLPFPGLVNYSMPPVSI